MLILGMNGPLLAADQPTYGTAVVDGAYDEWDLTNDFFANMYEAGNPDKDLLSKAYLRYECNSKTMFVLVLDQNLPGGNIHDDSAWPAKQPDNAWVKVPAVHNSTIVDLTDVMPTHYNNGGIPTGNPPESAWVSPDGIEGSSLEGFEASFPLDPGTYNIEIHINMIPGDPDARTSSTGRGDAEIMVTVQCDAPAPAPSIDIEKSTNGQDADDPTGPNISVGAAVAWEYVVTNTGNVVLENVTVTDDQGVAVSCPKTTLAVDESMTWTGGGTALAGQYENNSTSCAGSYVDPNSGESVLLGPDDVCDTDPSHYFGVEAGQPAPAIDIEKSTNGHDADIATGPTILVGESIEWEYVVTNTGNVELENVTVTDDQGVAVTCPKTTLEVGESMTCAGDGTAMLGQYANEGTTSGEVTIVTCTVDPVDGSVTCDEETRTPDDMDPSQNYGFIKNRPSLEVFGLTYDVGQAFDSGWINGSFTIENASDGPEVVAIGIEQIKMTIEYRVPAPKGKKWGEIPVDSTCTFVPSIPFILLDPNGTVDGAAQQVVEYHCTVEEPGDDVTSIRVTACVDIFNRDNKTFCYKATESDF